MTDKTVYVVTRDCDQYDSEENYCGYTTEIDGVFDNKPDAELYCRVLSSEFLLPDLNINEYQLNHLKAQLITAGRW